MSMPEGKFFRAFFYLILLNHKIKNQHTFPHLTDYFVDLGLKN